MSEPSAVHPVARAFRGYRTDAHPDGALAASEVTLSVDGRALVRRASWAVDGTFESGASGLFVEGARVRPLSLTEIGDLMCLTALDPQRVAATLPSSLLAAD